MSKLLCRFGLTALLVAAMGCGKGRIAVKGIVTLDGVPVEGALVVFFPEGGKGRPATATTGPDGTFRLGTQSDGDGAIPGAYLALVSKSKPMYSSPEELRKAKLDKYLAEMSGKDTDDSKRPKAQHELPALYGGEASTPFRIVVPPRGVVELDLHSDEVTPPPDATRP